MAMLVRRWTPLNGGLGRIQSKWLERTLNSAKQRGDRVIIFSHIPVYAEVSARLQWMLFTEASLARAIAYPKSAHTRS